MRAVCGVCVLFSGKVFHSNPLSPSVSLHNLSSSLLSALSISQDNVGATLLRGIIEPSLASIQDGGWTVLQLVGSIMQGRPGESIVNPTIPVGTRLAGHQMALKWAMDFLAPPKKDANNQPIGGASRPHPVAPIQSSNLPLLLSVIRSELWSKQSLLHLTDDDRDHLAILLLQSFLSGLRSPSNSRTGLNDHASHVRIHEIPNGTILKSKVFDGIILDIPMPIHVNILRDTTNHKNDDTTDTTRRMSRSLRCYTNLTTIVYNINLTFDEKEHFSKDLRIQQDGTLFDDGQSDSLIFVSMRRLVQRWSTLGIKLVCCQKLIHPFLQQLCLSSGILVLERLSIRHIESVAQVAGVRVISGIDTDQIDASHIGRIGRLEERILERRRYLFVSSSDSSSGVTASASPIVATLILHSPHPSQLSTLSLLCPRILKHLSTLLLRSPYVCAGAGATEMAMAHEIRRQITHREQQARAEERRIKHEFKKRIDMSIATSAIDPSLSSVESRLLDSSLTRRRIHLSLLHRAADEVAHALEDIATYGAWHRQAGYANQHNQIRSECTQQLRRYYQEENRSQVDQMTHQFDTNLRNPLADTTPTPVDAATPADESPIDDEPTIRPLSGDVSPSATSWDASADWQLAYEARCGPFHSSSAPTPIASNESFVSEPNSLYGYHASHPLTPVPVYRCDPDTGAVLIDSDTVLDLLFVKRATIQVALEATAVLIRVDQIVTDAKE